MREVRKTFSMALLFRLVPLYSRAEGLFFYCTWYISSLPLVFALYPKRSTDENVPGPCPAGTVFDTEDFIPLCVFKDGWQTDVSVIPIVNHASILRHQKAVTKQLRKE